MSRHGSKRTTTIPNTGHSHIGTDSDYQKEVKGKAKVHAKKIANIHLEKVAKTIEHLQRKFGDVVKEALESLNKTTHEIESGSEYISNHIQGANEKLPPGFQSEVVLATQEKLAGVRKFNHETVDLLRTVVKNIVYLSNLWKEASDLARSSEKDEEGLKVLHVKLDKMSDILTNMSHNGSRSTTPNTSHSHTGTGLVYQKGVEEKAKVHAKQIANIHLEKVAKTIEHLQSKIGGVVKEALVDLSKTTHEIEYISDYIKGANENLPTDFHSDVVLATQKELAGVRKFNHETVDLLCTVVNNTVCLSNLWKEASDLARSKEKDDKGLKVLQVKLDEMRYIKNISHLEHIDNLTSMLARLLALYGMVFLFNEVRVDYSTEAESDLKTIAYPVDLVDQWLTLATDGKLEYYYGWKLIRQTGTELIPMQKFLRACQVITSCCEEAEETEKKPIVDQMKAIWSNTRILLGDFWGDCGSFAYETTTVYMAETSTSIKRSNFKPSKEHRKYYESFESIGAKLQYDGELFKKELNAIISVKEKAQVAYLNRERRTQRSVRDGNKHTDR